MYWFIIVSGGELFTSQGLDKTLYRCNKTLWEERKLFRGRFKDDNHTKTKQYGLWMIPFVPISQPSQLRGFLSTD